MGGHGYSSPFVCVTEPPFFLLSRYYSCCVGYHICRALLPIIQSSNTGAIYVVRYNVHELLCQVR